VRQERLWQYRKHKLVLSGPVLELFSYYGQPFEHGRSGTDPKEQSLRRARANLRRKINANAGQWWDDKEGKRFVPLFVTLTFAENVQDIPTANKEFMLFVKRFNWTVFRSRRAHLKYVTVVEFQERGAIHYHSIFFNCPFVPSLIERLAEIWRHGRPHFNKVRHVKNVGAYMVKYMTKEAQDERLKGKKTYFSSQGLRKSVVMEDEIRIGEILEWLPANTQKREFMALGLDYEHMNIGDSLLRYLGESVDNSPPKEEIPQQNQVPLQLPLF